jgi:hypothetical protein
VLIVLINVATAPAARQELAVGFDHLPDRNLDVDSSSFLSTSSAA